ncbi:HEAT repeat domain-containing protein [Paenibacillus sp. 481]|uniref:HEAT repeat domain-containing protein n=1 Tax=Paenibacillus sp. 481 TaxID=2835869 RepID=UPI001E2ECF41|nr:HEAT repeat domain-containing protein [Paenibacillus sp. 481]UHA71983.1 HEAT repeat domain-containing protein [Paenibacillus sp. 481]
MNNNNEMVLKNMDKLASDNEREAFQAIREIKHTGKTAVPTLRNALRDKGPLRTMSIVVLGEIGTDAYDAVPELAALLHEEHEETQMAAALSLSRIGEKSIPCLLEIANQLKGTASFWAIWALTMLNPTLIGREMVDLLNDERLDEASMFRPLAAEEALAKVIAADLTGPN